MDPKPSGADRLDYLTPLFVLSRCVGIVQPNLQFDRPTHTLWKVYAASLSLLILFAYVQNLFIKIAFYAYAENSFFLLIDAVCEMLLLMSDVTTIAHLTFLEEKLAARFVRALAENDPCPRGRRRRVFLVEFSATLACVLLYHVYNFYTFGLTVPYVAPIYVFFREISLYLTAFNLLQMYNFVLIIRNKFLYLNRSLRKDIATAKRTPYNLTTYNVDVYIRKYSEYCDLVDDFGKLFGGRIFWVIGFIIIETVEGFQIGLNCFGHISLQRIGEELCSYVGVANLLEVGIFVVSPHWSNAVVDACVLQSLAGMFQAVCHQSHGQARTTSDLCYKLSLHISASPNHDDARQKLSILSEQFESRNPAFTAAGYFEINYSLITAVWTYMVSNLIISLTFNRH